MELVPTIVIPVAVSLALGILAGSASSIATTNEDGFVLEYGLAFKGFASFFGIVTVLPLASLPLIAPTDRIWMLLLAATFAVPTVPLILSAFFVRIIVTDAGIEARGPWSKARHIPWTDVTRLRPSYRAEIIETRTSGKLKLSHMLSGIGTLFEEFRRRRIPVA